MDQNSIRRILICRPNHRLGNMLLVTPLVQELERDFPNAKIDLFAKGGIVDIVFENFSSFGTSIKLSRKPAEDFLGYLKAWIKIATSKYDLIINVDPGSKSGMIATYLAKSKYKVFGTGNMSDIQIFSDHRHMAKYPVYAYWSYFRIATREISPLRLKLSSEEVENGLRTLKTLQESTKPVICLFTFATGGKIYDSTWWETFHKALSDRFSSNYEIIEILPVENISQFGHKLKHFYSKDIREIAALLQHTALFIGADSGMMHLAVSSGVPTLGLFKVTLPEKYKPYGGKSDYIDTNEKTIDQMLDQIAITLKN